MIKQKGVIHFYILIIVVIVTIILAIYLSRKSEDLSINPPSLITASVYLNTIDGKKLLHSSKFGTDKELSDEELDRISSSLISNDGNYKNGLVSLQDKEIYFYDKNTKKLETFPWPQEVASLKIDDLLFSVEDLSDTEYLINFSYNQEDHFTYIFDSKNSTFKHLKQFDDECKYIFCGGPEVLKKLSEDEFIFIQGAGDACWNAGVLHRFNLKTKTAVKLFDYSNGCSTEFDAYFGIYENSFIRAKHNVLDSYSSSGPGPDQRISGIYLTDLAGLNTELISSSKMPAKIDYLSFNQDNNVLYLYSNADEKYYSYDIKEKTLDAIARDSIIEAKGQKENIGNIVEKNKDFFTFEVNQEEFGAISEVYTRGQILGVKNISGNTVTVLDDSFLDQIRFEREAKECPYEPNPVSLDDKKYPFRFASHEYEDSAEVLNVDEIMFVVISNCNEYPSKDGKKSEWFLGAKSLVLNIKSGRIQIKGELNSKK